jgi:plasmid stabilization system protein ParE
MVAKKLKIVWSPLAKKSLRDIFEYIKVRQSINQATIVRDEIIVKVDSLTDFPEKFQIDPYLADEPEKVRHAVIWSYKVLYEVQNTKIVILEIFHTSRNPKDIGKLKESK